MCGGGRLIPKLLDEGQHLWFEVVPALLHVFGLKFMTPQKEFLFRDNTNIKRRQCFFRKSALHILGVSK